MQSILERVKPRGVEQPASPSAAQGVSRSVIPASEPVPPSQSTAAAPIHAAGAAQSGPTKSPSLSAVGLTSFPSPSRRTSYASKLPVSACGSCDRRILQSLSSCIFSLYRTYLKDCCAIQQTASIAYFSSYLKISKVCIS